MRACINYLYMWVTTHKPRWKLIESGVDRHSIKLRKSSIFVSGQLHGKVINFQFTSSPNLDDLAPTLSNLPNKEPTNNSTATTSAESAWLSHTIPVCLWNSRSLSNKLRNFQSFVYSSPFLILAITETWLHLSIFDSEVLPSGFVIFRHDRPTRGGGVLLAVHNSFSCRRLPSPSNLEIVTAVIGTIFPFLMCVVYIPPNSTYEHYLKILAYRESAVVSHSRACSHCRRLRPSQHLLVQSKRSVFPISCFLWFCFSS